MEGSAITGTNPECQPGVISGTGMSPLQMLLL